MQNLLTSSQIRDADAYTISNQPISSIDLMEAAAAAFVTVFESEVPQKNIPISIYCGTGNNGGDGLAVARLLKQARYENIHVKIARFSTRDSADFTANLERLRGTPLVVTDLPAGTLPPGEESDVIIDALLGSGLNKPVTGYLEALIKYINSLQKKVISIDTPSGFPAEGNIDPAAEIISSALTICFQRPRINFFFPESARALKRFAVVPIGLDEHFIESQPSDWKLVREEDVRSKLAPREPFSHKGDYGHALIIAGKEATMGAALLCADACLHSGAGLTSACIPQSGLVALNTRSPEIMALPRKENIPAGLLEKYSVIAAGPGFGIDDEASALLQKSFTGNRRAMILDADALTILSKTPGLWSSIPPMSILTPHMKEFDRMFGEHKSWWERIKTARLKSAELNCLILLKNRYTFIIVPDGPVFINPTGNPSMAVGGMGDVLTGMLAGFMAQGYSTTDAALIACFVHGRTGDQLKDEGMNSIPPRYLIEKLPFIIKHYTNGT